MMLTDRLEKEIKQKLKETKSPHDFSETKAWMESVILRIKHMKNEDDALDYILESCHYTSVDDMVAGKVAAHPEVTFLFQHLYNNRDQMYQWGKPETKLDQVQLQDPEVTFGIKLQAEKCPKCGEDDTTVKKVNKRSLDEPDQFEYYCRNASCRYTWKKRS